MNILKTFFEVISDALFPISDIEKELRDMDPGIAYEKFSKSPKIISHNKTQAIFHYKDEYVSKLIWSIKYKKTKNSINIGAYSLQRYIYEHFIQENIAPNKKNTPNSNTYK